MANRTEELTDSSDRRVGPIRRVALALGDFAARHARVSAVSPDWRTASPDGSVLAPVPIEPAPGATLAEWGVIPDDASPSSKAA